MSRSRNTPKKSGALHIPNEELNKIADDIASKTITNLKQLPDLPEGFQLSSVTFDKKEKIVWISVQNAAKSWLRADMQAWLIEAKPIIQKLNITGIGYTTNKKPNKPRKP